MKTQKGFMLLDVFIAVVIASLMAGVSVSNSHCDDHAKSQACEVQQ